MLNKIVMPALGQTVTEAVIEQWVKKEGDSVKKGELLLEITTDKASLEVESFFDGVLLKILHEEGDTVEVNTAIAVMGDKGEEIPDSYLEELAAEAPASPEPEQEEPASAPAPAASASPAVPAPAPAAAPAAAKRTGKVFISPRAKKIARDNKVCYAYINGSGPDGRIVEKDVQAYIDSVRDISITPAAKALAFEKEVDIRSITGSGKNGQIVIDDVENAGPGTIQGGSIPLSKIEKITAERMTLSNRDIPQFRLTYEISMDNSLAYVKKAKSEGGKITMTSLIVKAVSLALIEHPRMMAVFNGDSAIQLTEVNVGVAVGLDSGELIVPVIRNTERMSTEQIAAVSKDLVTRARDKKLVPDELSGGVITISNLGMFGCDSFIPIINPGETSILGIGGIIEKPIARDGMIGIGKTMKVTVAADHRVISGMQVAQFMSAFKEILEKCEKF